VLALLATHPIAGAVLDANFIDGDISPVVEYMMTAALPFILQTGVDLPPALADRFADLIVRIKPNVAAQLVAELEMMIEHRARRLAR